MSKESLNLAEILQFYIDNELNEIISDKPQNHYLLNEGKKENIENTLAQKILPTTKKESSSFITPEFSTDNALSKLAKRFNASSEARTDSAISLNAIVEDAKKIANSCTTLDELKNAVEKFNGCNLKKMATNTVFCDGNQNSKVMVIGEAPGNHEDLEGIPFCGDSGKVLDAMFEAINMSRKENFYITNVIFWRPPGNRRPTHEELEICRPFVERHIELLNPEVLVLVGATSMSAILGLETPISKIRGQFMDFSPKFLSRTIKTFAIFHPSYLMRQSAKKKIAWQDMLALEQFLKDK